MVHYEFPRKLCRFALLLATICFAPCLTWAADHYVCSAATGTADGLTWTNAFTSLPATLVRGDTYWVAAGSYGAYAFNTALNGTLVVTIKAPTDASHGSSSAGWTNGGTGTCHQGQASFTPSGATIPFDITTSYLTLDGSYRGNWNDPTGYGFKINNNNAGVPYSSTAAVYISSGKSNITLKYLDIKGSDGGTGSDRNVMFAASGSTNNYMGYCLSDTPGIEGLWAGSVQTFTAEYNWFRNNGSAGGHSQMITLTAGGAPGNGSGPANSNIAIRYNYFENSQGSGNIATDCGCANPGFIGNLDIYGNIFFVNKAEDNPNTASRIGAWNSVIFLNGAAVGAAMHVYNNTIVGLTNNNTADLLAWGNGASVVSGGSITVENNLWYSNSSSSNAFTNGGATWDYQSYFTQNSVTDSSAHRQCAGGPPSCGGGNPFTDVVINSAGHNNFHLALDTAAWTPLPPPYNVDMDGVVRTSSRGAFQFAASTSTAPAPPTGLTATVN